jgi:hypothetical protein
LAAVSAFVVVSSMGHAQPADDESTPAEEAKGRGARAIEKGRQALALYEQKEWKQAHALFIEANADYHSPVLLLYAGRCQRHLGGLRAAKILFRAVAEASFEADAPPAWHEAQRDAANDLAALDREIPRLVVEVRGATAATRIAVDGYDAVAGAAVEVDPGKHRIVVVDGERRQTQALSLGPGSTRRVVFDLRAKRRRLPAPEPPHVPPPPEGLAPGDIAGIVLTSLGATALAVGAALGGVALAKSSAAEEELPLSCIEQNCPSHEQAAIEERFDEAYRLASAADGLLIGGGVTLVAGVVLLIVRPGHADRAAVDLGPGSLRLRF